MPLHVEIRVNNELIEHVHIGRMTRGGRNPDEVNEYAIVVKNTKPTLEDWMNSDLKVTHRYGDGARELVVKALITLEGDGGGDADDL